MLETSFPGERRTRREPKFASAATSIDVVAAPKNLGPCLRGDDGLEANE